MPGILSKGMSDGLVDINDEGFYYLCGRPYTALTIEAALRRYYRKRRIRNYLFVFGCLAGIMAAGSAGINAYSTSQYNTKMQAASLEAVSKGRYETYGKAYAAVLQSGDVTKPPTGLFWLIWLCGLPTMMILIYASTKIVPHEDAAWEDPRI